MASYTVEQHVQMIKIYYKNECSLVRTLRALRPFYGRRGGPSKSTLQRLVTKFETTGSVNDQSTPLRQRNARSAENIAAVRESVQETPRQSISRRAEELGLSQTSTWRILRRDLGLNPYDDDDNKEDDEGEDEPVKKKKVTKRKPEMEKKAGVNKKKSPNKSKKNTKQKNEKEIEEDEDEEANDDEEKEDKIEPKATKKTATSTSDDQVEEEEDDEDDEDE